MKILHVVPGLNEKWNGIAVAAQLVAEGQRKGGLEVDLVDAMEISEKCEVRSEKLRNGRIASQCDEVWIHSMWTPRVWMACLKVLNAKRINCRSSTSTLNFDSRPRLVRMTHANLDPLRYRYHGWKKRLVSPIERWIFSKTDRVVVTGEWEAKWCRQWGLKNEFQVVDLKRFFNLGVENRCRCRKDGEPLHVLYLGRRHPLKGVQYLEQAMAELNGEAVSSPLQNKDGQHSLKSGEDTASPLIDLRIESNIFGEEKEGAWEWADVLCLPTLSENFGLVVAEALERGKAVITTDGAQAWEPPPGVAEVKVKGLGQQWWDHLVYLRGYREGSDAERIRLLKDALKCFIG